MADSAAFCAFRARSARRAAASVLSPLEVISTRAASRDSSEAFLACSRKGRTLVLRLPEVSPMS